MDAATLSIIIVSWNTRELLHQCLSSIMLYPPHCSYEVWVVDNNSTDGSVEAVRTAFPQVHLIENSENVGFAKANNQAFAACTGEYILLLNPDTEVKADALNLLVRFLEQNESVGAVGPRLLNPDGTLQCSCSPTPTLTRELWRLLHFDTLLPYGIYHMHQWSIKIPRQVHVLQGAALLLRRRAVDSAELLDEIYFMYSEEVDLCRRLGNAGWSLLWLPEAEIIHYGGQSTQQVALQMFVQLYRAKVYYFRKHNGPLGAFLYKWILCVAALVRLLAVPFVWLKHPLHNLERLRFAHNYWHLLMALPSL